MKTNQLLLEQFASVDRWTLNLVQSIPSPLWKKEIPVIQTNLNWQIGHILVSKYIYAIACIQGQSASVNDHLPMSRYHTFFKSGTSSKDYLDQKPEKERLLFDLNQVNQFACKLLKSMSPDMLQQHVAVSNPVATTKYEAITWAFKHQMWHNGQIALIRKHLL